MPAEIIYTAAGLAEWDRHVTGKLSKETGAALELMLRIPGGEPPLPADPFGPAVKP